MMFIYDTDFLTGPISAIIRVYVEVTWIGETTQLKSFKISTVVKTCIVVFRIMTLSSFVGGYQHRSLPLKLMQNAPWKCW
jgi:hypothetical protein